MCIRDSVKAAVEAGDKAAAQAAATTAYRKLDKAVAKGVIHTNQSAKDVYKRQACAAARSSCADALSRMDLSTLNHAKPQ